MTKTPWFESEKYSPVRKGNYECSYCGMLHYWTGKNWQFSEKFEERVFAGLVWSWRGLTEKVE